MTQDELDNLFGRAHKRREEGRLTSAFRLFLAGAKADDPQFQLMSGNFYSEGIGVKPNRAFALSWYRRAYRHGYHSAASNIGVLFRDENKLRQALAWFERAVKLHDGDASLEIAKIYLKRTHLKENDRTKAIRHWKAVCRAKRPDDVTAASVEEARELLANLVLHK